MKTSREPVVIVERGDVADMCDGVQKSVAGESVFESDAVFSENRTVVEFRVRTDNPSVGGKDGKLLDFFARFAYLAE